MRRWKRVTPHPPVFYRFPKSSTAAPHQSEQAAMLYRILPSLPDLFPGWDERPPLLRPAWQIRGGARPWSRGAAAPRPVRRRPGVHGEQHATPRPGRQRRTHRGTRTGHRVQRRRHRTLRQPTCSIRPPHRDGTPPPDRHLGPPVLAPAADPPRPETRCLLRPPRLSAGQTHQLQEQMRAAGRHYAIGHINARSMAPRLNEISHLLDSE